MRCMRLPFGLVPMAFNDRETDLQVCSYLALSPSTPLHLQRERMGDILTLLRV